MAEAKGRGLRPLDGNAADVVEAARALAAAYRGDDYLHVCVSGDGSYLDVFDGSGALRYSEKDGRRVR